MASEDDEPKGIETLLSEASRRAHAAAASARGSAALLQRIADVRPPDAPSRARVIDTLRTLAEILGSELDREIEADDVTIAVQHPLTTFLHGLATAFADLDNGRVPPVMRPANIGGGHQRNSRDREVAKQMVTLVRLLQQRMPLAQAVKQAVAEAGKLGLLYNGEPVKEANVRGWVKGRRPGVQR